MGCHTRAQRNMSFSASSCQVHLPCPSWLSQTPLKVLVQSQPYSLASDMSSLRWEAILTLEALSSPSMTINHVALGEQRYGNRYPDMKWTSQPWCTLPHMARSPSSPQWLLRSGAYLKYFFPPSGCRLLQLFRHGVFHSRGPGVGRQLPHPSGHTVTHLFGHVWILDG